MVRSQEGNYLQTVTAGISIQMENVPATVTSSISIQMENVPVMVTVFTMVKVRRMAQVLNTANRIRG
jgi:hypothetical protein